MGKVSSKQCVAATLALWCLMVLDTDAFGVESGRRQPIVKLHSLTSNDDTPQPSITLNGEEIEASAPENNGIFSATADMAIATQTPMETTIANVEAALGHISLIDTKGELLRSSQDIAPLMQGHRVALYFGAGWCPQCRELEYMLPQYIKALGESKQSIRLIYVPSDTSLEFQLDRMQKLGCLELGVPFGKEANQLKEKYGVWSGMESKQFQDSTTKRRSGVPAFIVLDTQGQELVFLDTESQTIAALGDWPLDDPKGIF